MPRILPTATSSRSKKIPLCAGKGLACSSTSLMAAATPMTAMDTATDRWMLEEVEVPLP